MNFSDSKVFSKMEHCVASLWQLSFWFILWVVTCLCQLLACYCCYQCCQGSILKTPKIG